MNQKIFSLGLSVETVSVYLLCCGLADMDMTISTQNLMEIWNGTKTTLNHSLADLQQRNIITEIMSDRQGRTVFSLTDAETWQPA